MTEIILVRHGETEWNASETFRGRADVDLNATGVRQAELLGKYLSREKIDRIIAMGPVVMMKTVSEMSKPYNIKTMVTLTPIMVDGTGMCGCCRVSVGGVTKFTCVDGPEFDGHEVDWTLLISRQRIYLPEERISMLYYEGAGG